METSLEKFKWLIDTQYPEIKKYIISKNEYRIILEDPMGDFIFGSNKDLSVIFEYPSLFPVKKSSVTYKERDSCFIITLELR